MNWLDRSFGRELVLGQTMLAPWDIDRVVPNDMYYVYVLQSIKDNKFYSGSTRDLKNRIEHHNKGLVPATKNRRPLELIYYEACLSKDDAVRREQYLKSGWGKDISRIA